MTLALLLKIQSIFPSPPCHLRANSFHGHYSAKQKKQSCIPLREVEKLCFFECLDLSIMSFSQTIHAGHYCFPKRGTAGWAWYTTNSPWKTIVFCSSKKNTISTDLEISLRPILPTVQPRYESAFQWFLVVKDQMWISKHFHLGSRKKHKHCLWSHVRAEHKNLISETSCKVKQTEISETHPRH